MKGGFLLSRYPPNARTELSMHWADRLHRTAYTESHVMNEIRALRVCQEQICSCLAEMISLSASSREKDLVSKSTEDQTLGARTN